MSSRTMNCTQTCYLSNAAIPATTQPIPAYLSLPLISTSCRLGEQDERLLRSSAIMEDSP